jgi:hypothetical protein
MSLKHLLLVAALAGTAHADVNAAAKAFSEGQAAQLAGDYDRAGENYELAYSIVPSKEALRSAVRARMLGKQLSRAASLAEILLASYASDPASVKLANEVLAQARAKLARVQLACSTACTAAVDGKAATIATATSHAFYVAQGAHELEVDFEGDLSVKRKLDGEPGGTIELKIEKPAPRIETPPPPPVTPPPPPPLVKREESPPPPPPEKHGGLPKWVAIGGGIATLGFAGLTTWSGLDTWSAHDAYAKNPTDAAFDAGVKKQDRTNELAATTFVLGAGTAVVAIFFTKWHADDSSVQLAPTGNGVSLSGRF